MSSRIPAEEPEISTSPSEDKSSDGVVSERTMEIVVAALLMAVAAIVMVSSYRSGAGWARNVGPQSGYFPFYVALIMLFASGGTLVQRILRKTKESQSFIERGELVRVLQVLIPTAAFVVLAIYIGIYVATFLFISLFMLWLGHYPLKKTIPVALALPILLFLVFEKWFLVPLPKGPLERLLGY
ncbi:MAG TPA: tripartite tricarboxylate transporter TctB family protein [Caldimonas sp.]|jgi:uncharacterized membrane protein